MTLALALSACVPAPAPPAPPAQPEPVAVIAPEPDPAGDEVLYRYGARALKGSRFGGLALVQQRVSDALVDCGLPELDVDGSFGAATADGIAALSACPGYEHLADADSDALTEAAWDALAPEVPVPDAFDRALTLTLTFEGTDFDRVEWNDVTPGDERSALTWGPFGATAGWGAEVQGVLARVDASDPTILPRAFGRESATVRRLLDVDGADAAAFLAPVAGDRQRRDAWLVGFTAIGALPTVREAYLEHAVGDGDWLAPAIARLAGVLPDPAAMTEIDFALFLDLAVQVAVTDARVADARLAVVGIATAPARRQAIAEVFAADLGRWQAARRGRSVAYYVDGVTDLSEAEADAFRRFGRARASDVGLSDDRLAPVMP